MNLSTYIFIGIFFVFVLLLMSSLLIVRKFHDKVKAKLIDILNKTFWNNSIRSLNITYLKTALAFVVSYKIDQDLVSVMVLAVLGVIPLYFILVLIYYNERLDTPEMKNRIERMYQDIHLGRNYLTKFYYPIFLIRRFIFVIIPVLVPFYPIIQLLALIFLNLTFLALYVHVKPHIEQRKLRMEFLNEWMIHFVSLHLICFTGFILKVKIQYYIGYSFVISIFLVLVINLIYMIYNISRRIKSKNRKKRIQKAYESRFLNF